MTETEVGLADSVFENADERAQVLGDLANPSFEDVCDAAYWRANIPEQVVKLWPKLSMETRIVAYLMASITGNYRDYRD